jgi:hypothetical protein
MSALVVFPAPVEEKERKGKAFGKADIERQ